MRAEILARMQHHGIACEVRIIELDEVPQIQSLFFVMLYIQCEWLLKSVNKL